MSEFKSTIDWDRVRSKAEALKEEPTRRYQQDTGPRLNVNWWKPHEGAQRIRFIPAGNEIENLPFKYITRHELPYVEIVNGNERRMTHFVLCWKYIAMNNKAIAIPLKRTQRLTDADIKLYQAYGCPICKARTALAAAGVNSKVFTKLNTTEKVLFNLLDRRDNKVYLWTASKTVGGAIVKQMDDYLEEGSIPLDPKTGHDYTLSADGVGMGRRYNGGQFLGVPKPLIPKGTQLEINVYDLTEIAMLNFKSYQKTIDALYESFGSVFMEIGYEVPGNSDLIPMHKQTMDSDENEDVGFGVPTRKVRKPEPDNEFTRSVPPSRDEDDLVTPRRIVKKKKKAISAERILVRKKTNAPRKEDDDDIPF